MDDGRLMRRIDAAHRPFRMTDAPLPRSRRRPVRLIAAVVFVLAATTVGAVILRPNAVVATWTAAPTSSELGALTDAAEDACRDTARDRVVRNTRDDAFDPAMSAMASLPVVAFDRRGSASAALFADASSRTATICTLIPVSGQPTYVELSGASGIAPDDFGAATMWVAVTGSNWDYGSRWEIAGRLKVPAAGVEIVRADGQRIRATVNEGWFLAWWPNSSPPVGLDLLAPDGALIEAIDISDRFGSTEPSCRLMIADFCLWSY
jgi:hypothetical protein